MRNKEVFYLFGGEGYILYGAWIEIWLERK